MITDKDREDAEAYLEKIFSGKADTGSWHGINDKWTESELIEMQTVRDSRIRQESAEQARKEAADRAVEFIRDQGMEQMEMWGEYDDNRLRTAILDDSTTDHIPDTGEKLHPEITNDYVKKLEDDLAIAVKALEKINERHSFADIVDDSYIISRDALKEMRG